MGQLLAFHIITLPGLGGKSREGGCVPYPWFGLPADLLYQCTLMSYPVFKNTLFAKPKNHHLQFGNIIFYSVSFHISFDE